MTVKTPNHVVARRLTVTQDVSIAGTTLTATGVELNKLAGLTAVAAEINRIAGITAGAASASKALIPDVDKDLTGLHKLTYTQAVQHAYAKFQTKAVNYTMVEGDSGQITYVNTDAVVITLPATVAGMCFTLVNDGADGAVGFSIDPAAADKIMGCGISSADNKDLINTKATAKKGDMVRLVGDGVNGWYIQAMHGTWARE